MDGWIVRTVLIELITLMMAAFHLGVQCLGPWLCSGWLSGIALGDLNRTEPSTCALPATSTQNVCC